MLHIAVLMNDTPSRHKPLETERGLSMLIEYDGVRILFDTGYDDKFIKNAKKLGHSLAKLNGVVLSHSHFDHVAGYNTLLSQNIYPKNLFIGKHFFEPKYIQNGPVYTNLASSLDREEIKKKGILPKKVEGDLKLANGIYLVTCADESKYSRSTPTNHLRLKDRRFVQDNYDDEIAFIADTKSGSILVTGSCHHGIPTILNYIEQNLHKSITAVIGGMNLSYSKDEIKYMEEHGVKFLGVCNHQCKIDRL